MTALVDRCHALATSTALTFRTITTFAARELDREDWEPLLRPSPDHPYGRNVILSGPKVEAMVATWTPGIPCAPHDHGGSMGVVRILRGSATHRVWAVRDGELTVIREETQSAGDILTCGPDMVHSMVDGGADESLVTLHLYIDPIDHMRVYDLGTDQTHIVEGKCGAWVPTHEPELIRRTYEGFIARPPHTAIA